MTISCPFGRVDPVLVRALPLSLQPFERSCRSSSRTLQAFNGHTCVLKQAQCPLAGLAVQGDTIVIEYNDKLYHIDVLEVQPNEAISVVETDVEVDFAPPKDYKEPDYTAQAAAHAAPSADATGAAPMATDGDSAGAASGKNGAAAAADAEPDEPKFLIFGGAHCAPE